MAPSEAQVPVEQITRAILVLRGHKVLLDSELAALYGVATKRLNEQVRRNRERFPADFMFQLSAAEAAALRSQFATLESGRGRHRKYLPYAFTEHGAIMAATILHSPRAFEMSIYVVRAFVTLRELVSTNRDLARKLQVLERSLLALDLKTQQRFKEVYDAIRALTSGPTSKRRGIGFTADLDSQN